jgi:hypothetical protein
VSTTRRFDFVHRIIDAKPPEDPHIKAVGDIDGDGFSDVVVASSKGGPLVWYGNPRWKKYVIHPEGTWSCSAQLVDMDGDGDSDILISDWYTHDRIEWYENPRPDGDPTEGPWRRHIIGRPRAHDICAGDTDGDGQMEIVTRAQGEDGGRIAIWRWVSGDSWSMRSLACPTGEGLALADLSRQGRLDIVIGGRWYEAPADALTGHWQEHVFADWPADATVRAGDINGDGRADIVLARAEGDYRLSWFEAPPDPRSSGWPERVVDGLVSAAHSLVVCDIDGDGQLDIVAAEMHQSPTRRVIIYHGEPGGRVWRREVIGETGSHNLNIIRLADTGRLALVGANWSGEYQPLELWELCATRR